MSVLLQMSRCSSRGKEIAIDVSSSPRIFEAKDWADLFGNFEDPIDELVKEFYSNARYTEGELKCWV